MADEFDSDKDDKRQVQNQPYDEYLDVGSRAEEIATPFVGTPSPRDPIVHQSGDKPQISRGNTPPQTNMSDSDDDIDTGQSAELGPMKPLNPVSGGGAPPPQQKMFNDDDDDDDDDDDGSDDDDDDDDNSDDDDGGAVEGKNNANNKSVKSSARSVPMSETPEISIEYIGAVAYDPADYDHLPVTQEIKELFQYITRYTPQTIDLDHKIKPFIPDYIPAVGDIDAFLKVPRPDGKADTLGLTQLDEPCAKQSDPTVLDLQLRAISKQTNLKAVVVKSIPNAEKSTKAIDNWIHSISEIHRSRPPPNVHYTKNMPDIDTLMQEWPPEFEELLKEVSLPSADMECDLAQYVDMCCSLLDIPVHPGKRTHSLHVLFTLYSEFKNSQHFRALADENKLSNDLKGQNEEESDFLVL